jgi:hypothetical protein
MVSIETSFSPPWAGLALHVSQRLASVLEPRSSSEREWLLTGAALAAFVPDWVKRACRDWADSGEPALPES